MSDLVARAGGLAKVVFMTHYTMGDILEDAADAAGDADNGIVVADDGGKALEVDEEEDQTSTDAQPPPKLASYILSASVSGYEGRVKLLEPISFTMTHIKVCKCLKER